MNINQNIYNHILIGIIKIALDGGIYMLFPRLYILKFLPSISISQLIIHYISRYALQSDEISRLKRERDVKRTERERKRERSFD